jgi:hypothetical protein
VTKGPVSAVAAVDASSGPSVKHRLPKAAIDISPLLHDAGNQPNCSIRPDTERLANTPFQAVQGFGQLVFF